MRRRRWDVIVVGAGPAGASAARTAAHHGLRTLVLEEHPEVGSPVHCTGKLSAHAFRDLDLPLTLARNALRGATFYGADGFGVTVRRDEIDSYVVDRDAFDRWLVGGAQEGGAELVVGARATGVQREANTMVVHGERNGRRFEEQACLVIDAEGARARLAATFGLMLPGSKVLGIQYEMAGLELDDEETVEVYLGREWAPGFFAWMMPVGGSSGRVGLCVDPKFASQSPAYYLGRLIAEHPVLSRRAGAARVVRRLAGWIPLPGNPRRSYSQGFLVVGDAAGQVKATSGGGIYFSLLAGRLAGQAARSWVEGHSNALSAYHRAWTRRFGREMRFTIAMRHLINTLPDEEISHFLRSVAASSILRGAIERHGDSQYQSKLLRPVLRTSLRSAPRLVPTVLRAVAALLSTIWVDAVGAGGTATAR